MNAPLSPVSPSTKTAFFAPLEHYLSRLVASIAQLVKRIFGMEDSESFEDVFFQRNQLRQSNQSLTEENLALKQELGILERRMQLLQERSMTVHPNKKSPLTKIEKGIAEVYSLMLGGIFFPFYLMALPYILIRKGIYQVMETARFQNEKIFS